MGLPEGHPEKDGVLVDLATLPQEIKGRLEKKRVAAGEGSPAVDDEAVIVNKKEESLNVYS